MADLSNLSATALQRFREIRDHLESEFTNEARLALQTPLGLNAGNATYRRLVMMGAAIILPPDGKGNHILDDDAIWHMFETEMKITAGMFQKYAALENTTGTWYPLLFNTAPNRFERRFSRTRIMPDGKYYPEIVEAIPNFSVLLPDDESMTITEVVFECLFGVIGGDISEELDTDNRLRALSVVLDGDVFPIAGFVPTMFQSTVAQTRQRTSISAEAEPNSVYAWVRVTDPNPIVRGNNDVRIECFAENGDVQVYTITVVLPN